MYPDNTAQEPQKGKSRRAVTCTAGTGNAIPGTVEGAGIIGTTAPECT